MTIEQTVEIPPNRRLFINVPAEIPTGRAVLTLTAVSANDYPEKFGSSQFCNNHDKEDLRVKLQKLQGSFDKNAFGGLNGLEYQNQVRKEWED